MPTMAAGWDEGRAGAAADWKPQRLGFAPPDVARTVRAEVANAVLALAGGSPTLFGEGRAEGKREALRQFLHATLQPLAKVIQREAQAKLLATVTLDFTALGAANVQGKSRAYAALVGAGMDPGNAVKLTGLSDDRVGTPPNGG